MAKQAEKTDWTGQSLAADFGESTRTRADSSSNSSHLAAFVAGRIS
jgi:hypothetical protein